MYFFGGWSYPLVVRGVALTYATGIWSFRYPMSGVAPSATCLHISYMPSSASGSLWCWLAQEATQLFLPAGRTSPVQESSAGHFFPADIPFASLERYKEGLMVLSLPSPLTAMHWKSGRHSSLRPSDESTWDCKILFIIISLVEVSDSVLSRYISTASLEASRLISSVSRTQGTALHRTIWVGCDISAGQSD